MPISDTVFIGTPLSIADVVSVARHGGRVRLADEARDPVIASRAYVDSLVAADRTVYGITTGFGRLASIRIASGDVRQLQRNLLVSHAMGVGVPFTTEVVRAMLLLRAQSLSFGFSGIRINVIELLLGINEQRGVTLVVVTHDQEIAAMADARIYLRDGKVAERVRV